MFDSMLGLDHRVVFFRELATMVKSGVSIGEALGLLETRPGSPELRAAIAHCSRQVSAGERFSQAMEKYPKVFSPLNTAMVRAGEESGRLDETLGEAADYLEREQELRQMLSRETFYPKILIVAVIVIPLATNVVIAAVTPNAGNPVSVLGGALLTYLGVFVLIVAAWFALKHFTSSTQGAEAVDRFKLRVPLIGPIIAQLAWAKVCRAIAALYKAGMSSSESLELAGTSSGNRHIEQTVRGAVKHVQKGTPLSEALTKSGYVPDLPLRMLQTGEETGDIDSTLGKVADYFEAQSQTSIRRLSLLIVPIATVIMAVVVLIMAARAYTGYFDGMFEGG